MSKYICIAILSGIISSFSQILLKKSADKKNDSFIADYMNIRVIVAYGITFLCMLLTIISFRGIPYKYGSILESLTYIYIMVLSKLFIKEKITKKRIFGNLLIVIGVILFSYGN